MERRWLSGFLASIVLVQGVSVAQADEIVVDLPNPFDIGGEQQSLPQPLPPSPVQSEYVGTVQINSVSRKTGGTLLRVNLSPALALQRLEVKVLKSQVKIYESTLITATGQRIAVREFKETGVLKDTSTLVSENLNLTEAIMAIELRAESYQAESDLELKAISNAGVPRLSVQPREVVQPPAPPKQPTPPAPVPPQPPPPPTVPDRPPRYGNCLEDLCVGDRAFNIQRDYRQVEIVNITNGTFVLRFLDNGGQGAGWTRKDLAKMSGCNEKFCVGNQAYNISRDNRLVTVVGISPDGKLVLRFNDNGGVGGGWSSADLAMMSGCVSDICVGTQAVNIQRDYRRVTVVGIQADQRLLLRFDDNGGIGGGWSRADLAVMKGCVGQVCVGTMAYNIERDYRLTRVMAIQADGKFVLTFQDNGTSGGNWDFSSLALLTGCGNGFCVNDDVIVVSRNNRRARIAGIQMNGLYVLRFLDNGLVGGNWANSDLARPR
ncbi:beta-sandwich domain-containing protein [Bdellovibrio svalbardensis]|uniref:Beta-sandwich domain-containing protein n=1 Tax=Bdellovibrio svalbardensis TaxID=2972972 RepID=A0ABT6DM44_9BACT|nr:beta-sandwich domain-containing protein [Bdellovibrio svalbardensis]MDG0817947.1 beta-sandwich domain-containing protein [Bdellovibrio svalbardensis]